MVLTRSHTIDHHEEKAKMLTVLRKVQDVDIHIKVSSRTCCELMWLCLFVGIAKSHIGQLRGGKSVYMEKHFMGLVK